MKVNRYWVLLLALAFALILSAPLLQAQSYTTGDVTGTVTDQSGAVVPNATVTIKSDATGATQTRTSNAQGAYRFALLPPGSYTLSANAPGFNPASKHVAVVLNQAVASNIQMAVAAKGTTVEVTAQGNGVQTDTGDISTGFSTEQIQQVPNPGNDLSAIAQTAPGSVMNTQSGYGNFSSFGVSATSNNFTLDGQNDNDPFLNLNNSGATNLLLGQNEISEATVTSNGYTGQNGQGAGAQINYITKSGSNNWHGNANYYWNGRFLNANNWFNKNVTPGSGSSVTPRPFDNVNQWGASLGGPIVKDHTFFFLDTEGIRIVLPTSVLTLIPSPQFATATLANIGAVDPTAVPFYSNIFNLYSTAKGAAGATPVPGGGCGTFTLNPAFGPGGLPCALQFHSIAGNFTHEWLLSGRIDQIIGSSDKAFLRYQMDRGLQATYTDPINPIFDAQSNQPEYQGQFSENHTFGTTAVNNFVLGGRYYSAIFGPKNLSATLAAFPTTMQFADASFANMGGINFNWPQGRNVTQYQLVDDYSLTMGRHTIKIGANYNRNDVSDHDYGILSSGFLEPLDLNAFYAGGINPANPSADLSIFEKSYPTRLSQPMALYFLGGYVEDDVRATNKLKLNLTLRAEHDSDPVCQTNCFARLVTTSFFGAPHDPTIPYNQVIKPGFHQAFTNLDHIVWEPRVGFAYSPFASGKAVFRGGFGIFADTFPGVLVDNFSENPPLYNTFITAAAPIGPGPTSLSGLADATNTAFLNGFNSGLNFNQIVATTPFFTPPGLTTSNPKLHIPRYAEYNLEFQQQVTNNTVFSMNYVGNHGYFEPVQDNGVNAFAPGFVGLPAAPPDMRFGTVNQIMTVAVSNYNGLTTSLKHNFSGGFQTQINYTWSHALDEISNGGISPFNFGPTTGGTYTLFPQDPYNIRRFNYGNADYDVRHYFSMNYVWDDMFMHMHHWGPKAIFGGWVLGGTIYARTGLPFTVIDNAATASLAATNYGGTIWATPLSDFGSNCNGVAAGITGTPCLSLSQFAPSTATPTGFGNQRRNQYRGPRFFDTDLSLTKNFAITEHMSFGLGAQAFNLFNHANFDQPVNDIANTDPTFGFGHIIHTVNTPTSILGSFLGGDASPRLLQIKGTLTF